MKCVELVECCKETGADLEHILVKCEIDEEAKEIVRDNIANLAEIVVDDRTFRVSPAPPAPPIPAKPFYKIPASDRPSSVPPTKPGTIRTPVTCNGSQIGYIDLAIPAINIPLPRPDAKLQERFDQLLEAAEEAHALLLKMAVEKVAPIDPFHPTLTRLEASIMLAAKPAANRQADAGQ